MFKEIKKGNFEEISICEGDILGISSDGRIVYDKFNYTDYGNMSRCNWWDYDSGFYNGDYIESYIDELKAFAAYEGFSEKDIDGLLQDGFTPDEIADYIYCG